MFKAKDNTVIVTDMESGAHFSEGNIMLMDDNMKEHGIRHRWAKVHSVGSGITDIKEGDWVCVIHGRWSRVVNHENLDLQMVDWPSGVILAADEKPTNSDWKKYLDSLN